MALPKKEYYAVINTIFIVSPSRPLADSTRLAMAGIYTSKQKAKRRLEFCKARQKNGLALDEKEHLILNNWAIYPINHEELENPIPTITNPLEEDNA